MIDVYRSLPVEVKHNPIKRSAFKTLYWKMMIRHKGKWKDRFIRCQACGEVFERVFDSINCEYVVHHRFRCEYSPFVKQKTFLLEDYQEKEEIIDLVTRNQ